MSEEIGDDEPIPLREAVRLIFHGRLTKSALRTEARKGNLEIIRIANKDFVTKNAIRRMIEKCTKRPAQQAPSNPQGMTAKEACRIRLEQLRSGR